MNQVSTERDGSFWFDADDHDTVAEPLRYSHAALRRDIARDPSEFTEQLH